MALDKSYYIHTTGNGRLGADTTASNVDAMFDRIRGADQLVIHFHGGLVSKKSGLATAQRLTAEYEQFAHPVFFVWESGITESPVNNFDELVAGLTKVAGEAVFKKLSSKVTKWTVGKLQTGEDTRAAGQLELPDDLTHEEEMRKIEADEVPYEAFDPVPLEQVGEVEEQEQDGLSTDLEADPEFVADVEAILVGHFDDDEVLKAALPQVSPQPTLMDEIVLAELRAEVEPGTKGLLSAAVLAKKAAAVFARVVKRFLHHRDHGVYTTVFEELVRELYFDNVVGVIWGIMKTDTADTFKPTPGEVRGGELFLRKLAALEDQRPTKIVLVGHSAGAIFVNEMLKATRAARAAGQLPPDFAYTGVVFLAPACTFSHFAQVMPDDNEPPLYKSFRMFTMDDEHERTNKLASFAYPRSLLYFVSGLAENENGEPAFDMPLVGMERYYWRDETRKDAYNSLGGEIAAIRDYIKGGRRVVWSPSVGGSPVGFRADSISHGGFDDTGDTRDGKPVPRATIDSVRHILELGWD